MANFVISIFDGIITVSVVKDVECGGHLELGCL